ncbi:MAG: Bifunctional protein GlmU [Promethearchaeota archaeon]|nr:MAG: Bifunctional protein GlmU [Candidatus Lokiarchaeota archaeon]
MRIVGPIAGIGSRLRPFTLSKPKAFMRVAGQTVLDHILTRFLNTFDKNTELILIVGYKKHQIIDYVEKHYADKFKLTFIEQIPRGYRDDIPYYWGLGEAVYLAHETFYEKEITSSEDNKREGCLIFLGDMILLDEYSYLLYRYYESDVDGIITVMKVPEEDASAYGIVDVDENNIIMRMVEKPKEYISNLAIAGIYAFSHTTTQALFENLRERLDRRTKDTKEIYLTESLQYLIDSGHKIAAVELKKGILDFGKPSALLNGNKYLLEHQPVTSNNYKSRNIEIDKSLVKNFVHIGNNCVIKNSVISNYVSIGKGCYLQNCIIENCVIERNTHLKNIITSNSIIGSGVHIENMSKSNVIIGDKCTM